MEQSAIDSLTPRQIDCLRAAKNRLTAKEAARLLGISPRMVEKHWAAANERLGVDSTRSAIRLLEIHEAGGSEIPTPRYLAELMPDEEPVQSLEQPDVFSGDVLREDRTPFDFDVHVPQAERETSPDELNRLRRLGWIALIALALALAGIASSPMIQSVQNIADLFRTPIKPH